MAYISIIYKDEEYSMDISDERAFEILKKVGILDDNKQIEVYEPHIIKDNKENDTVKDDIHAIRDLLSGLNNLAGVLNSQLGNINKDLDVLVKSRLYQDNTAETPVEETIEQVDTEITEKQSDKIADVAKEVTDNLNLGPIKLSKKTLLEKKALEYGIDKIKQEVESGAKTVKDFAKEFDVNTLYVSELFHAHDIKSVRTKSTLTSPKKHTKPTLNDKASEYGINKIREEYESRQKSMEDFCNIFGVKRVTMQKFLSEHGIKIKNRKHTSDTQNKNKETQVKKIDITKLSSAGTVLKRERKDLEQSVEIQSGTCLKCGYRDVVHGHCGYSILTLKDRHGKKSECNHFVDLGDIL